MGSPKEEDEGGALGDVDVGTIVWVRRRNGSWWPGRILGPDELAESHLLSPRTGTPVKLLGREDASVDWYNLEKSKRVKAFRCGEFDACIEKAMAMQGAPTKKREKYARREDAILHALELERKQFGANHQSHVVGLDNLTGTSGRINAISSSKSSQPGPYGKYGRKFQLPLRREAQPQEAQAPVSHVNKSKLSKQKAAGNHLMGVSGSVHQVGLRLSPKRKFSESGAWEPLYNPINSQRIDLSEPNVIQAGTNYDSSWSYPVTDQMTKLDGNMVADCLLEKRDKGRASEHGRQSGSKLSLCHPLRPKSYSGLGSDDSEPLMSRAKRSQSTYLPVESSDTHSNSNIPLTQEPSTENSFKTKNYLPCTTSLCEEYTSPMLIETHESDYSHKEASDTETEDDVEHVQNSGRTLSHGSDSSNSYALQVAKKLTNVETTNVQSKLHSASPLNTEQDHIDEYFDHGVSKWYMKGKRNHRSIAKRSMDLADGASRSYKCNGYVKDGVGIDKIDSPNQRPSDLNVLQPKDEYDDYDDDDDVTGNNDGGYEVSRFLVKKDSSVLKVTRDFVGSYNLSNEYVKEHLKSMPPTMDSNQLHHIVQRPYCEDSAFYEWDYATACYGCGSAPMLIDVDLKVQAATYQGEHVPLVSLMSRLNGKAIIGHPVQIEILDDGSTDHLVSSNDIVLDHRMDGPPVWRTGRRTVMQRIPRSNPVGPMMDAADSGAFHLGVQSQRKKSPNHFNRKVSLAKRSISHARKSVSSKYQKHPSKKGSLSNPKIRTLSSMSRRKKTSNHAKLVRVGNILDGLIRSEGAIPLVTCVPVKVAFSRILEAVGRPSSVSLQRVRTASPAVRDPT